MFFHSDFIWFVFVIREYLLTQNNMGAENVVIVDARSKDELASELIAKS